MSSIAACPRCTSTLQIPFGAFAESSIRCPVCGAEFAVSEAPLQALPEAQVIEPKPSIELPSTELPTAAQETAAQKITPSPTAAPLADPWDQLRSELTRDATAKVDETQINADEQLEQLMATIKKSAPTELFASKSPTPESAIDEPAQEKSTLGAFLGGTALGEADSDEFAKTKEAVTSENPDVSDEQEEFVQHEWEQVDKATDAVKELTEKGEESAQKATEKVDSGKRSLEDMLAEFRKPPVEDDAESVADSSPTEAVPLDSFPEQALESQPTDDTANKPAPSSLFEKRSELPKTDSLPEPAADALEGSSTDFDQSLEHTVHSLQRELPAVKPETEPVASPEYDSHDFTATNFSASESQIPPKETLIQDELLQDTAVSSTLQPTQESAQEDFLNLQIRDAPQRAGLKSLASIGGGVLLTCLAAGYGLPWLLGPKGDFLQLASWAPAAVLPDSLRATDVEKSEAEKLAEEMLAEAKPIPPVEDRTAGDTPEDGSVAPASASSPVELPESEPSDKTDRVTEASQPRASVVPLAGDMVKLLVNPRVVTTDELHAAVEEARAAVPELLTGDLSDRSSIARKGSAYKTLARLAQAIALADASELSGPSTESTEFLANLASGKDLLRHAVSDKYERDEVSQIAARWAEFDQRPNYGILFAGTVVNVRAIGALDEYLVKVSWEDESIILPVLMPRLRFTTGDFIGVVGVVAANPRESLRDYTGDSPQTIVADDSFPLEE